ncbi:LacI family DNA-binding transcriptional regulator [Actinophytocola gossypii]|uniref:LacI family DNA-binding transcriptional regulator n=1 Tax=Actinophytocola gossypii TaxID=2812003 RepID=A0ABT2J8Y3_9PSEU|nr:LacI family DNA-binding transcriptional regulator [Actinophytocola gossypii]MCT2584330.1 LacI family DNA-binding transcriptional regulator [Actinophytocola gossypii]
MSEEPTLDEPKRRPTIGDVAKAAGVSPSTASRALTGQGYAAAAVKAKVLAAADQLGYVPDEFARSLKRRTNRLVGVVISDLRNQFYADLAAGIEQVLGAAGYQMVLVNDDGDTDRELAGVRTLLAMRVPGTIVTPLSSEAGALLTSQGVRVVEVDRQMAESQCDAVLVDSEHGARAATGHLLELGHRRIAFLIDELEWTTGVGRLTGYREALRERGVDYDPELVVRVGFGEGSAATAIASLLEVRPDVTAVFAANNLMAEGVWQEMQRRKLRVPKDVSLVAFDDLPWMSMVQPAVSAVSQPVVAMGAKAAELLLARLSGTLTGDPRTVWLEPTFERRGSTRRLPG